MLTFIYLVKLLFLFVFVVGGFLFWRLILSYVSFSRRGKWALLLERIKEKERKQEQDQLLLNHKISKKERVFIERSRLANLAPTWNYWKFQIVRIVAATILGAMAFIYFVPNGIAFMNMKISDWILLFMKIGGIATAAYWFPHLSLMVTANQRKSQILMELAKLSQRLALCINGLPDIREALIRASRTLIILKPYIQELSALWTKDQRAAIEHFKIQVGVSEVYPLVNALHAITKVDSSEVARVLQDHTRSIDSTLEYVVNRKIERAPVWISFLIMIPFTMDAFLFIYPWLHQIVGQLSTSF